MFFFIGGVQAKTVELDKNPRLCPSCGLYQARLKRTDQYLSIFFIPVLRIKKGEPFVVCDRCRADFSARFNGASNGFSNDLNRQCKHCGKRIDKGFSFCPFCGGRL